MVLNHAAKTGFLRHLQIIIYSNPTLCQVIMLKV
jgi:hypothetical protein